MIEKEYYLLTKSLLIPVKPVVIILFDFYMYFAVYYFAPLSIIPCKYGKILVF